MRKFLLLLTLISAITLAACSQAPSPAPPEETGAENQPAQMPEEAEPAEESPEQAAPPPEPEPLQPIFASEITDGTYAIEVSSSSSMFRIIDAQLTVEAGEMWAVLTLSGTGYEKLYMGTGEEAEADSDEKCIYYVEDSEGKYTYTVPVAALDQETDVAAWSIRKETWYDRVLVFQSALLPAEALR